jgi:hypothetical protein
LWQIAACKGSRDGSARRVSVSPRRPVADHCADGAQLGLDLGFAVGVGVRRALTFVETPASSLSIALWSLAIIFLAFVARPSFAGLPAAKPL